METCIWSTLLGGGGGGGQNVIIISVKRLEKQTNEGASESVIVLWLWTDIGIHIVLNY